MMDVVLGAVVTVRVRCSQLATVQEIAEAGSMEALVREMAGSGLLWVCIDEDPATIEVLAVEALP